MKKSHSTENIERIEGAHVALLQARWHSEHTDRMVDACRSLLEKAGCERIDQHVVPGAYELPLAAKLLAKRGTYEAIVIFGAVVRGETDHYQVIVETCTRELGKVMYDFEIPVIMELMPVSDIQQLVARSSGEHNKGFEAALAAAEMVRWKRRIAGSH